MAGKMKAIQAHRFLFLQVSPHRFPEICFRDEGDLKVQTALDYDSHFLSFNEQGAFLQERSDLNILQYVQMPK